MRMWKKKKYANSADVSKEGRMRKRSCQLRRDRENDRHGWRKGREWETTPERLRGEPAAPSQHSSSLPPCVLCHGYQTGLPVQPVNVFFSGRNERGTNVSRSVSYTINVNCPGMHKHTEGAEDNHTVAQPECEEPACTSPGNFLSADRNLTVWRSCVSLYRSEAIVFVRWVRWGLYLIYMGQN